MILLPVKLPSGLLFSPHITDLIGVISFQNKVLKKICLHIWQIYFPTSTKCLSWNTNFSDRAAYEICIFWLLLKEFEIIPSSPADRISGTFLNSSYQQEPCLVCPMGIYLFPPVSCLPKWSTSCPNGNPKSRGWFFLTAKYFDSEESNNKRWTGFEMEAPLWAILPNDL